MSVDKLLPCPFCAGEAEYIQAGSLWGVLCKSCAASSGWRYPKREAAEAWNLRDGRKTGQMTIWDVA